MNHHSFNPYNNIKSIPRNAQTHYAADIYPRHPRNITAQSVNLRGVMTPRSNAKIFRDEKPMGRHIMPIIAIVIASQKTPAQKRVHRAHVNKPALAAYFDNIDAADKIAAARWLATVVAELDRADAEKQAAEQARHRNAQLAYRAALFDDMAEKNKMIDDATAAFYARQQEMQDRFLATHYNIKTK